MDVQVLFCKYIIFSYLGRLYDEFRDNVPNVSPSQWYLSSVSSTAAINYVTI